MEGRTQWARNGEVNIAFRVMGEGPFDIVFVSGLISHIEVILEEPGLRRWFERLGRIGRVILVDRRGTGLSDPIVGPDFSVEDEVADLEAVLDAVGTDRVVLQAYAAGGPLAVTFAARRPERVLALVLYACMVRNEYDVEFEWADTREQREARIDRLVEAWGTGVNLDAMAPDVADDVRVKEWLGRLERLSMTPSGLRTVAAALADADVRPLLPDIRVPALVLHRTGDRLIDVRHSRYLAEHLPGAKYVELPGINNLPMVGDTDALIGEIEEFLTGGRRGDLQRELRTVLFTDVVEATATAARVGDGRWRDSLAAHESVIREEIRRFGGHEVKTVGDGFLVTFDAAPSAALRCARAMVAAVKVLGIDIRAGLHTGECEIIGDDVGGMAVHIAARVSALAGAGEVLASGTAFGTVVGSGLDFDYRGEHDLKGVPGLWPIFKLNG